MVLSGDKHEEPPGPPVPRPWPGALAAGAGACCRSATHPARAGKAAALPTLVVFGHSRQGSTAVDLIHSRSPGGGSKWAASERLRCGPVSVTAAGQAGTGRRVGDGNDPAVPGR